MIHGRETRPRNQLVLERLDALHRPFRERFDPTIVEISYEAHNLMTRRRALRKEAKTYPLHISANEESSRYFVGHFFVKGNLS